MTTVKELIEFLQKLPQDMPVARTVGIDECLVNLDEIKVMKLGMPKRNDEILPYLEEEPSQEYVVFPGHY